MSQEITYDNLSERLVEEIPELLSQYESELKWWKEKKPGPHVIYGDLLNPYLITLLRAENEDTALSRIFQSLERLAKNSDVLVQEVVAFTVCERLIDNQELLAKAQKFLGPETKKICDELLSSWNDK